jgi:hypothetical protein
LGTNGQTIQTAGKGSGAGGRITIWSDSDASGQGYIWVARNTTLNSIGGSTTTFTGGGDIHFGGGLDNGAATVTSGRTSGDGVPDGWAVDTATIGIFVGHDAASSADRNTITTGGGNLTMFAKSTSAADAMAFQWTSRVDSGEGQIEIRGESAGWGVQLNRSGGNDTYSNKSVFTSRSNSHPAIYIKGKSSGGTTYMALLGSYGDAGTDNLLIQAVGSGGIDLVADGPTNHPALGLQSTAVLSSSGKITIDGGTSTTGGDGAIHFGSMYSGAAQGSVQIGSCAVLTCANSLVTSSNADVDIIANRVTTYSSISTTVATAGNLKITPAVGSTAFSDFGGKISGLTLSNNLGSLQLGRPGDTTSFTLNKEWTIAGPITVHGSAIQVSQNLTTTGTDAPITLKSTGTIVVDDSKVLQTNGSDVVLWGSSTGGSGYIAIRNNVCINTNASCDVNVATSTGSIYLGGGSAGTTYPTGPVLDNTWRGIRLGETSSGVKLLSGGGDISLNGQSSYYYGIEIWQGVTIKATTGSVSLTGRSTNSGYQGLRVAGGSGDTLITSGKTSGTAVSIRGSYATHSGQYGVVLSDDDATVSATGGGDVVIEATDASAGLGTTVYLSRATVSAAAGGRVQVKAPGHIEILTSNITTAGPANGSGGEISIWSDSDDNNAGKIYVTAPSCISSITNCSAPTTAGGSKIVIGGGASDSNTFFPAGGAVANSTASRGVQFGAASAADGVKVYSGGGDIRIASEMSGALSNYYYGQLWYGGTRIHSGSGMVDLVNTASGTATTTANYGFLLEGTTYPIVVTSQKGSGDAIKLTSTTNSTGDYSNPLMAFSDSSATKLVFQATGGGDITMSGTTPSTQANSYSFDLNNVDILANSGSISLSGNRGFWFNRIYAGNNNFGAASGSSTSNIELLGNRYVQNGTHANNFKTTGSVTIAPLTGSSYLEDTTFPNSGNSFTGVTGLTFGNDTNTRAHTAGSALTGVTGPITFKTGTYTGTGSITTTAGPVSILSSGTVAVNENITAGSQGILVKSAGRITTSAGASVASPRALTTNSGPITLWTTGAAGGVTLNNYVHLNSNTSGTGGADITIGGGAADANDSSIPGGNATSNASSGIILGTSNVDQIVRVSAGTGDVVLRGESTSSSTTLSGIDMKAGVKITGATVNLFGKANNPSTTNNTAGGIFHYEDSTTAKTVIEATKSFADHETAITVRGETSAGYYGVMLANQGALTNVADNVTLKTTGTNADISISGSTGSASRSAFMGAGLVLTTSTGDVLIDGGDDSVVLSRSSTTRKVSYSPIAGQAGGNVTIRTPNLSIESTGVFDVSTAGILTLEPPIGQAFSTTQTFPLSGSVINTGGVIVGSADNNQNLTGGADITASGDVKYLGGLQTFNFAITTTNGGNIEFYPTTNFNKSTPSFSADGDILIGTSSSRAASVTLSSGGLSAGGDLKIFNNQTLTQSAALTAAGGVVLDTTGAANPINIQKNLAAGAGGIKLKANQDILVDSTAKTITTSGGGDIIFWANASGTGGEVDTGGLDVVIDSNGGDIIIAGGADDGANGGTASDSVPDNALLGRTAASTARLRGSMDSDAGRIWVRAQHGPHTGAGSLSAVYLAPSARVRSTTGDIALIGTQNSGNTSTGNQYGIWLGSSDVAGSKATVSSTSGNIYIDGDASQSNANNRRGVVLFGVDISTGGDIEISGKAPSGRTGTADVVTWAPSTIAASGNTLISGPGTTYLESTSVSSGTGLTFNVGLLVGTDGLTTLSFTSTALSISGSGPVVIEPRGASFTATQSLNMINFANTVSNLRLGKTGNTAAVYVEGTSKVIAGDIEIHTSDFRVHQFTGLSSSGGDIFVVTNSVSLESSISANSGILTFETQTPLRDITLGTTVSETLSLPTQVFNRITADTMRLNTDGNVNVTSSYDFRGRVNNLAIRAGGNVTGSAGVVITVANLGIDAGGTVNFPGNQAASVVALQGSAVTYNQVANYTVASVDGIDPEFGYGVRFAISNVPVSGTVDAFMAVAFNPPPTVTIRDKFGNTLAGSNLSAANYAVTSTFNLLSTATGTPTASGLTPTRSGGTFTFDSLKVSDGTGTANFTFAATRSGTSLTEVSQYQDGASFTAQATTDFTTATYNIQAGEPASIDLSFTALTAAAGKTGLAPTATLKDVGGNTIASGNHANATISITIAGADGTIVSGASASTVAGVSSFPNLVIGGKVNTDYTLTFSVTFTDGQSQSVTVSEDQVVNLTFGDPAKVTLGAATQTAANRTDLADIVATVRDAYDNVVTDSTASIALAFSDGDNLSQTPVVSGYSAQNATAGVATFSGISLAAKADDYAITASSGSLTTASQVVTLTHGAAYSIALEAPANATNDVVFGTQPVVRIYDQELNPVTSGAESTQTVTLSATGATLGGTMSMPAVAGVADFTGKGLKLTGLIGPKPLKASISSPTTIEATSNITLQFGAATQLAITQSAAGFVSRTNFDTQPIVEVRDVSGNAVTNYSGTVSIGVGSGATISGTTTITLNGTQSGLATFSGLGLYGTVGSYTLTYSAASLTDATQSASLTHGVATQLSVTTEADGARAGIEFSTQPVVKVLDQDSNVVTTGDASTSNIRVQSSGASLSGTLTALADQGVATFTNLKLSGTIGTYQLSYSALTPALAAGFAAQSHDIELAPGVATEIHVTQQPTGVIAGEDLAPVVSVQLRDAWQNVVTTDSTSTVKPVLVDASSEVVIDSSVTASAVTSGEVEFTGLSFTSAGDRKIRFESGAITKLSDSFTITHAAASQIVWTSVQPTAMRNDIAISPSPSFEIRDQYGNPALTGPRFTVSASTIGSNAGNVFSTAGSTQVQASNSASVTFSGLSLRAPEDDYQLRFTATDGSTTFSVDSTSAIPLTFGNPTQLSIDTPAAAAGAGLAFGTQPVVEVLDSAGNLVTDSTLAITAAVSGRDLVGTATVNAISGVADFANSGLGINGAAANGLSLVFTTEYPAGTPISTSQSINVTAGTATLISMIQQPTTLVTRESFSPAVSIELRDQFGNKVESDSSSTVSVVLYDSTGNPAVATSGQPALTAQSATSNQGVATFSGLGYAVAPGTGYYLRASLNGFTISSGTFTVLPGAATSVEIDVQPSTVVGAGLTPTGELIQVMPEISLYDQDGYLATTTNGTATITATNSGDLSEGATSATVTNGQAEFSGIKLVGTPGQDYSLVFAFGAATKTSAAMQVTHNVATKIVLDRGAANGRSHEVFTTQPIVKILDRYNNLVTSGNDSSLDLRVVSSGGSVSGANISAQGGIGTFTGLSLGGAVNTDYTFTYEATFRQDIATATQTGVQVSYGFASQLRIQQEPVSLSGGVLTKTGDALATQPVIHVTDNWGNIVENSSIQITASLFATQDVRDRLISATATAVNGVATFNGLAMVVRPETDYKIRFAAGSLTKTSSNIQVRHGDAAALRIITEPSSVDGSGLTMTGEVLATTPVVEAIDFDGNRATSVNGDIATATVSVGSGDAITDLHSNGLQHNQAAFSNGVAAFQNLKVVALPGVEQRLTFGATISSTAVATPSDSAGFTLTNNVAHQLSVLTQPCAGAVASSNCGVGITGDTLQVQPVIEIQDRYGNRVPEFTGDVAIATSTAGSSILVAGIPNPAAQKATAIAGVATFSDIGLIALPSAQTQFSFTSTNLLATTSANVVVAAAAPHKLVMATQPVGGRTGDALTTQPVVRVLDRFDNPVLSDNSTVVTANIASGSGGTLSSLAGSANAVGGIVTFTDLVFSGVPNANYSLGFSSGSLVGATSSAFSVTNGLAAGLNITSQPVGGKTGDLLANLVELELLDDELNLAGDDNSTVVTVGFAVTDGNARFVNSSDVTVAPSVTAVGGVVDFGDLRVVGTPGFEYKLVFTATPTSGPSYNSPHSAGFTLTHANPAQLVITQSPVGGIVGGVLATQPTLRVEDRFGNPATSDNSTTVAVSIYSGTGGSIVSGGSATAVGGVVNFGAITASGTPGEPYKLRFSATANNSANFSVDDNVGYRLSKTASLTFSYAVVAYAPDAIVTPTFATDSPASPVFTTSSNSSVCELVIDPNTSAPNGQVRVKGVGSCVVTATIPNAPYYSTATATETLVINKALQAALVVTSANNVDYWSTMTPTASGGSGTGAVSFLVAGDCRIIGTTLIPGNAGSPCEITARKLGDANYQVAYSDPMELTINKISQTPLRMANANNAAMTDVTLFTSGGSGTGSVTFQITTNRSVAGVAQCELVENGTKLRALSSGDCGVSATKASSTNHLVAISPEQTITFTKAEQRVNFTSALPSMPTVGSNYTPLATASSGLAVTYSITSGSGTVCAWDTDPTKIKFLAAGSCEIRATQAGDGQYSQASSTQTIVVNARNQTITFAELVSRTFGQPGFFLQATASSGLPVSFSVGVSAGSPACSITGGNFVNLLSAGNCEIIASQGGNQEYLAATPVKHIFTIAADLAGAPHLISISAGNQSVTASFNPPSYNGGSPITAYRLVATDANGDRFVNPGCPAGSGPISCTLVGVPNSQQGVANSGVYSLKVAAITVAGVGNYSLDSRPITASAGDMGVTHLIASPGASSLTLDWDAPAALDSTFQQYQIYVWPLGEDEPETPTTTSTGTTATFSTAAVVSASLRQSVFSAMSAPVSVAPADSYAFKVVTITSQTQQADDSLNTTFGMQQSFTAPGAPTQLQLQELPSKLSLGWSTPAFDGGKPILDYTVKVNGAIECQSVSSRVCEYSEPLAGMTYEFEVFATNSIGDGAVATYSITMPAPPSTGEYVGPMVTKVMPNPAKPGALIVISGSSLDSVQSVAIAGRQLEFSIASANVVSAKLPANIAEGLYDIVITSSYGRLTVQDALRISLASTEIDGESEQEPDAETQDDGSNSGSQGSNNSAGSNSSGESGSKGSESDGDDPDSSSGTSNETGEGEGSSSEEPNSGEEDSVAVKQPGNIVATAPGIWWFAVAALLLIALTVRVIRKRR